MIASFSTDRLFNKNRTFIREQKGGPAFFAGNALKAENVPFTLLTFSTIVVEIILLENDEFGRFPEIIKPAKIDFSAITTPFLFISPILNEFLMKGISAYRGKAFIDLQGFVRDGNEFGKKKIWSPSKEVSDSIFCLKGNEVEMQYIPKEFLKKQQQKNLIITRGKRGCELFIGGKKYQIEPKKQVNSPDTIGAGDSFIAYLISEYIKTNNFVWSTKYAVNKVLDFLSSKSLHHNQSL